MVCLRCNATNPEKARYCVGCRNVLPRVLAEPALPSSVEFNEAITYLHPKVHYETDAIRELHGLAREALDGEDVFDDLEDLVQAMAEMYEEFERNHTQPFLRALMEEAEDNPNDPFPHQLSYVLKTGSDLFQKGQAGLKHFFESESDDPDELEAAVFELGEGHDYLYFGIELVQQRIAEMETDEFEEAPS